MAEIDSLEIKIKSSADDAVKGIDALTASLKKLNGVRINLSSVSTQLTSLSAAANSVNSSAARKISALADALRGLSGISGVKIDPNLAKNLSNLSVAMGGVDGSSAGKITALGAALNSLSSVKEVKIPANLATNISNLATAMASANIGDTGNIRSMIHMLTMLQSVGDVKVSKSLGDNLLNLGAAVESLQGMDFTVISQLADGLRPLGELSGVSDFGKVVNSLKKLPDVFKGVNGLDVSAFAEQINTITAALKPLNDVSANVASSLSQIPNAVNSANVSVGTMATSANAATLSYTELYHHIVLVFRGLMSAMRLIGGLVDKSNEYVEDLNLFNAAMGTYAASAQEYAEKVSEIMGIDPAAWMRNQGVFMTIATGFGIAGDRAAIMSQQLTQLGYDLSSFFNIKPEEAMQKLQSGIAGELEPLRRLGYDLSQAKLEAIALSLGLNETYRSMDQAEKGQLRYYAIMSQVTTAQGDMARTLNAPANQLRVLQAQASMAARAIGNVFIPALNAILPVAIAVVKAVRMIAQAIASLFGFSLPEIDYSGISAGASSAASDIGAVGDAADGASGSAEKLKKSLMGFDEINQLTDPNSGGGGGGGGGGGDGGSGGDWDWDLPTYDFLSGLIQNKIDAISSAIQPFVDWVTEHISGILDIAIAVGAAILTWKVTKPFMSDIGEISQAISGLLGVGAAIGTIVVSAALTFKFTSAYYEDGDGLHLIADTINSGLGALIAGRIIEKIAPGKGIIGMGVALTVSALATLKVQYDRTVVEGFDERTIMTSLMAAIKAAGAGALFAKAAGASTAVGGAIGFGIAIAAAAIVTLVALDVQNVIDASAWGKVSLTAAEVKSYAERLLGSDVVANMKIIDANITGLNEARFALNDAWNDFRADFNALTLVVGVAADPESALNLANSITGEGGIIDQVSSVISAENKQLALSLSVVPEFSSGADGENGEVSSVYNVFQTSGEMIEQGVTDLGNQLAELLVKGAEEGLTEMEAELAQSLMTTLSNVMMIANSSEITTDLVSTIYEDLPNLTRESFTDVMDNYQSLYEQTEADLVAYFQGSKDDMITRYDQLMLLADAYELQGNSELAEQYRQQAQLQWEQWENFHPEVEAAERMKYLADEARKSIAESMRNIFVPEELSGDTFGNVIRDHLSNVDLSGLEFDYQVNEARQILFSSFERLLSTEDFDTLLDMSLMFDGIEWDILGDDLKRDFYNLIAETFGEDSAAAIFEALGYDLSGVVTEEMEEAINEGTSNVEVNPEVETTATVEITEVTTTESPTEIIEDALGDVDPPAEIETPAEVTPVFELNTPGQGPGEVVEEGFGGGSSSGSVTITQDVTIDPVYKMAAKSAEKAAQMLAKAGGKSSNTSDTVSVGVKLVQSGWTSVTSWVADLMGIADISAPVALVKSGWTTVSAWVTSGAVNAASVAVKLYKSGWTSIKSWIGDIPTIELKASIAPLKMTDWKEVSQSYNGTTTKIVFPQTIKNYARGGFPDGDLFIANEAGPELVGRIGNRSAVANRDQIGDTILNYMNEHDGGGNGLTPDNIAAAVVSALKAAGVGTVQVDGKTLASAINRETQRTGRPAIQL